MIVRPGCSLREVWEKTLSVWRVVRGKRRIAVTATDFLRPGIYHPISETLWSRKGADVPTHLVRTKGGESSRLAGVSPLYELFRSTTGAFLVLGKQHQRTAELVVVSFDGGIVVLDQVGRRVFRTYGTGRLTQADEYRRRIFTDHVSAPKFRFLGDGTVVEEELVEGSYLGDLAHQKRAELITTLVEQFAGLTASYGSGIPSVSDGDLETLLQRVDVPPGFACAWESSSTAWFSTKTPWIPTPREANAKNIVVRSDGRPAPIDLGDLQIDPYFIYPVGMLIAAGGEIIRPFLLGEMDFSLATLFATAGQSWVGTPSERKGLILARIAYAAYKDSLLGGVVDREIFSSSLRRRWEEVRAAFSDLPPVPSTSVTSGL